MPVLPVVGSMMTVVRLDLAVAFGGVDHRHADAVLDRPERVEVFGLADDDGFEIADEAAETDQRRLADGGNHVISDIHDGGVLGNVSRPISQVLRLGARLKQSEHFPPQIWKSGAPESR